MKGFLKIYFPKNIMVIFLFFIQRVLRLLLYSAYASEFTLNINIRYKDVLGQCTQHTYYKTLEGAGSLFQENIKSLYKLICSRTLDKRAEIEEVAKIFDGVKDWLPKVASEHNDINFLVREENLQLAFGVFLACVDIETELNLFFIYENCFKSFSQVLEQIGDINVSSPEEDSDLIKKIRNLLSDFSNLLSNFLVYFKKLHSTNLKEEQVSEFTTGVKRLKTIFERILRFANKIGNTFDCDKQFISELNGIFFDIFLDIKVFEVGIKNR